MVKTGRRRKTLLLEEWWSRSRKGKRKPELILLWT